MLYMPGSASRLVIPLTLHYDEIRYFEDKGLHVLNLFYLF